MSNYIINGDFSDGFTAWNNGVGGGVAYTLDAEQAMANSWSTSKAERYFMMKQDFSVNNEIVSGKVTVWCKWQADPGVSGGSDGYVRFIVELFKPNMGSVTLLDTTKTALTGEGYLLNSYDIAAELDQYGNYSLWVGIETASAENKSEPETGYLMSHGWYDNINVDVAVQKYKTVIDKIGSAESHYSGKGYTQTTTDIAQLSESQYLHAKKFAMENFGLLEDYYMVGAKIGLAKETFGVSELYTKKPKLFRGESFGLMEMYEIVSGLARHEHEYFKIDESFTFLALPVVAEVTQLSEDYAYRKYRPIDLTIEDVGFSETYSAVRIRGNLETLYTVGTPTKWTDVELPITAWIKIKTEI